jgi:DNA-binding transcriptional LysR family regulator
MDRLITMATFVKVAQAGGFSAAARALKTSPSYVTKQVQGLERLLGVRLLNRTTRNVRLTEIGTTYYERCVRILAELKDADQVAQGLQSVPSGTLRLNASTLVLQLVDPVIDQFSELHPDAQIDMVVTDRMADLVREGFDLAIHPTPIIESSLIVRQLSQHRTIICGAPAYLAAHGTPRHPSVTDIGTRGARKGFTTMEGSQQSIAARPTRCRKTRSSLVRRLVQARDDPAKQRIRRWLSDIQDDRLLSFGLTPDDIVLLRGLLEAPGPHDD